MARLRPQSRTKLIGRVDGVSSLPPGVHAARNNRLNDLDSSEWVRLTKSWFVCDGRAQDITEDIRLHPASFPPDMVERFIKFFTKEGETVFDPFVGTGSTLVAAYNLRRNSIGIELNPEFYENARKRIERLQGQQDLFGTYTMRIIHGDAMEMDSMGIPEVDFCITSPPYADMLRHSRGNVDSVQKMRLKAGYPTSYGEDPRNLGNISDYDQYIAALTAVFLKVKKILKRGRYLVVVLQNFRDETGTMRPLAWDVAKELAKHYLMQQEFIWCQNQKPLGCWGYPSAYVSNVHHHYCLVFKNG